MPLRTTIGRLEHDGCRRQRPDQPGTRADALGGRGGRAAGLRSRHRADARPSRGGGLSAYAKGVSLGIVEPRPELVREQGDRLGEGEQLRVDLLGRAVPVVRTPDGLRAVNKGKSGNPAQIEKYLAGKFGNRLEDARAAMAALAAAHEPADLYRRGFRLTGRPGTVRRKPIGQQNSLSR